MNMTFSSTSKGTPTYVDKIELPDLGFQLIGGMSGTSPVEEPLPDCTAVICLVECTQVAGVIGDLLGVYIQTYLGNEWIDVAHIQVTGNLANDTRRFAKVNQSIAETMFEVGGALGANTVRNILGAKWRYRYALTGGGGGTFRFSVKLQPIG